jgi:hypothetical protein
MCTSYSDIDELMQDLVIWKKPETIIFNITLLSGFLWWLLSH